MKIKIYLGLLVLSFCFVIGGLYLVLSINTVIERLEDIIVLQKVEFFRKDFQNNLAVVQTDLLLKDSPHARNMDVVVKHGEELRGAIIKCYSCHHEPHVVTQLDLLKGDIENYKKRLSSAYTIRANRERLENEKQLAFNLGLKIMHDIKNLVISSSEKTSARAAHIQQEIASTRQIILILITIGPIVFVLTALLFLRRFTDSVSTLILASRRLKEGDLNYRISEKLEDEFQELAVAFNEMATSLNEQCLRVESAQKRYRMLFESAGDAILILEATGRDAGRIVSANLAAADMHGYAVDELLARTIQDLDTPESAKGVPARIQRILDGEWLSNIILDHRRKDGSVFPVEVSAGLFEVDNHRYILVFNRDISERVKTEHALQRSKQMAMVGQTAAGLAHEIKNPLAGIKVSMEVLASELDIDQEDREVFLRIVGEINRIEKLLKNMLSYARPPEPQFQEVDLNLLVENAVKNLQFSLKSPAYAAHQQQSLQIIKNLAQNLPHVPADSAQLQQVLLNLLLNAAEAMPGGGAIEVTTGLTGDHQVMITISDTGKGIPERILQEIFNPFFTTKTKGSGLGLAISKRLVEQHNGSLTAGNNPAGRGASFIIRLPAKPLETEGETEGTRTIGEELSAAELN
jgi:two-component system, NtrC family, sensor histidine kinase AtoS